MTRRQSNAGLLWIRQNYDVPAARGVRVRYLGGDDPREGKIIGVRGPHLLVRLDGDRYARPYHPTWKLEYLEAAQ